MSDVDMVIKSDHDQHRCMYRFVFSIIRKQKAAHTSATSIAARNPDAVQDRLNWIYAWKIENEHNWKSRILWCKMNAHIPTVRREIWSL